jgi:hypothetical protein
MGTELLAFWLRLELGRALRGVYKRPCEAHLDDLLLPNPRSLTRGGLELLRASPEEWVLAPKVDGTRTLLVRGVFMRRAVLCAVGRRYDVAVLADEPCGEDDGLVVVVDAERAEGRYVAHDVFVLGRSSEPSRRAHAVRMALLPRAVEALGAPGVETKQFWPLHRAAEAAAGPGNDGLIFARATEPVTFGSDPALLKWKPHAENTIDLLVERRRCGAHLMRRASARSGNGRKPMLEVELAQVPGQLPCVWEFRHDGTAWRPSRRRPDKNTANSDYVIQQTELNLHERVEIAEIAALSRVAAPAGN